MLWVFHPLHASWWILTPPSRASYITCPALHLLGGCGPHGAENTESQRSQGSRLQSPQKPGGLVCVLSIKHIYFLSLLS